MDLQFPARCLLEFGDLLRDVAAQWHRARPRQVGQGRGGDVLGAGVELGRDPVRRVGDLRPEAGHRLVADPPEQERVGGIEDLVHVLAGCLVEVRWQPATQVETVPGVLFRSARALHDAVHGHEGGDGQSHGSSLFARPAPAPALTFVTNDPPANRHPLAATLSYSALARMGSSGYYDIV